MNGEKREREAREMKAKRERERSKMKNSNLKLSDNLLRTNFFLTHKLCEICFVKFFILTEFVCIN